ncbi:hypothetical protein HK096_008969, partial [Nowakowskiella sp. JEL0078]
RFSRTQIPSKIDIAKGIEKFKRPLLACQHALNLTLAASNERNTRLRAFTDDCDRCKHELDKTRKNILLRAVAVRRSQRGLHPLHPEFVPSHMRLQTAEFDDISDADSITSGAGGASVQASIAAAAAARSKMRILAQRSNITPSFNQQLFQEASPPQEAVETDFELSASMISQMEREHEEYQAAEAAAAAINVSHTNTTHSKIEALVSTSLYHSNSQVMHHNSGASNFYHPTPIQLSRTNSGIFNQNYPISRSSSGGANSRDAYLPVFQPFNRKESYRGRDLTPKRQNSTRQHLRSVSMDARSHMDSHALRSVASSQWTISTSAAYSINSSMQSPMTLQQLKEVTTAAATNAWTISSGAASPSSWISNTTQSLSDVPDTFDSTAPVNTSELSYADFSTPHIQPVASVRVYGYGRPSFGSSGFESEVSSRPSFSTTDGASTLRIRGQSFGSNVEGGEHRRNRSNSSVMKGWEEEGAPFSPINDPGWVEFVVVQTREDGVAFERKVHEFDWGKDRRPSKVEEEEEEDCEEEEEDGDE